LLRVEGYIINSDYKTIPDTESGTYNRTFYIETSDGNEFYVVLGKYKSILSSTKFDNKEKVILWHDEKYIRQLIYKSNMILLIGLLISSSG